MSPPRRASFKRESNFSPSRRARLTARSYARRSASALIRRRVTTALSAAPARRSSTSSSNARSRARASASSRSLLAARRARARPLRVRCRSPRILCKYACWAYASSTLSNAPRTRTRSPRYAMTCRTCRSDDPSAVIHPLKKNPRQEIPNLRRVDGRAHVFSPRIANGREDARRRLSSRSAPRRHETPTRSRSPFTVRGSVTNARRARRSTPPTPTPTPGSRRRSSRAAAARPPAR